MKDITTENYLHYGLPEGMSQLIDDLSYLGVNAKEVLNYLSQEHKLDMDDVVANMNKRKIERRVGELHPYSITLSTDGRYRTYIKDDSVPSGRRQIVRVNRFDLILYLAEYYGVEIEEMPVHTMRTLFPQWIDYKSKLVDSPTITRIRSTWKEHYEKQDIVDIPIRKLDVLTLRSWMYEMAKENRMDSHSYGRFSMIVKQMLDYAVELRLLVDNPYYKVNFERRRVLIKEIKKEDDTQIYSKSEKEQLFLLAKRDFENRHNKVHQLTPLAVMFQFETGLRLGELCAIRYEDVKGNILTVQRMYRCDGKIVTWLKGRQVKREVPLTSDAVLLIEMAKQRQIAEGASCNGYIFSMKDTPVPRDCIQKAFYRYCDIMGIPKKGTHTARKTFVSSCLDSGMNPNTVRKIAGHADERTTLNNYCYDRRTSEEIIAQMEEALHVNQG